MNRRYGSLTDLTDFSRRLEQQTQTKGRLPDIRTSTSVLVAYATSIVFVILAIHGWDQIYDDLSHFIVWGMMTVLVLIGLLATVFVSYFAYRRRVNNSAMTQARTDSVLCMKILFLWLFGFIKMLHMGLSMAIDIQCLLEAGLKKVVMSMSVLTDFINIGFVLCQLLMISVFKGTRLPSSKAVHVCLMIIIVANISSWFNSMINDLENLYTFKNDTGALNKSLLQNETHCYWHSNIQNVIQHLLPYLIPARLEYSLFASLFIIEMRPEGRARLSREVSRFTETNQDRCCFRRPIVKTTNLLAFLTGILLNLPLLILANIITVEREQQMSVIYFVMTNCRLLNAFTILICLLLGYHHLLKASKVTEKRRGLSVSEVILLISTAGFATYFSFGLLSGIIFECIYTKFVTAKNIIAMLNAYIQGVFILQARRCEKTCTENKVVQGVSLILCITNFYFWFESSFTHYRKDNIFESQDELVGQEAWTYIQELLFPLLCVYQFTCGTEFYRLYTVYRARS